MAEGRGDKPRAAAAAAFHTLLWCAAVGVLVLNVILVEQNRRFRQGIFNDQISAGHRLANLAAVALDGRLQNISLPNAASPKMLIITFSPGCAACQASQPVWSILTRELRERGWRIAWVSRDPLDPTRDYCLQKQIPLLEVFADPPHRTYTQLSLEAVPNTIVVGTDGVVEKVWPGVLGQSKSTGLFAYFGIPAPELPAAPKIARTGSQPSSLAGRPQNLSPDLVISW